MLEIEVLRAGIIPYGNCVVAGDGVGEMPEAFAQTDSGVVDPAIIAVAQQACGSCIQRDVCYPHRELVAEALWRQGASSHVVVSGEELTLHSTDRPDSGELVTIPFKLEVRPEAPGDALSILRQGIRARQLKLTGKTPRTAQTIARSYIEELVDTDPPLFTKVTQEVGEEAVKGLGFMVTAIMQQKDYANLILRRNPGSTGRYKPERFDIDKDGPILARLLEDMVDMSELNLRLVANKAVVYPPSYFRMLIKKFYREGEISWGDFSQILDNNRRAPGKALEERYGAHYRLRAANPEAPETFTATAARIGRSAERGFDDLVGDLYQKYADNDYVSRGLIRSLVGTNPGAPDVALRRYIDHVKAVVAIYGTSHTVIRPNDIRALAQRYRDEGKLLQAAAKFCVNVPAIKKLYPMDNDMADSTIRKLCQDFVDLTTPPTEDGSADESVLAAAHDYKDRVTAFTRDSDGSVPISTIRKYAARKDCPGTFMELQALYTVDSNLYHLRKNYRNIALPIARRISALYTRTEIDEVANNITDLLGAGQLMTARADMELIRGIDWQDGLGKIFDPKNDTYLAFTAALSSLQPTERLAFARYYKLMPLLYGHVPNTIQIEHALSGVPLETYCIDTLLPCCQELVAQWADSPKQCLSLGRLSQDLAQFKHDPYDTTETETALKFQSAAIVAGSEVFQLAQEDSQAILDGLPKSIGEWILARVSNLYPPHLQKYALESTRTALQSGVLQVLGNRAVDFQLTFSHNMEMVPDVEQAVAAHKMGLDRMLYGTDLGRILEARLGTQVLATILSRSDEIDIAQPTAIVELSRAQEEVPGTVVTQNRSPLDIVLSRVFGDEAASVQLSERRERQLIDALREVFYARMEDMPIDDDYRPHIALAWQTLLGGELQPITERYGIAPEDVASYIDGGTALVGDLLRDLPQMGLGKVKKLLAAAPRKKTARQELQRQSTNEEATGRAASTAEDHPLGGISDQQIRSITRLDQEQMNELFKTMEAGIYAQHKLDTDKLPADTAEDLSIVAEEGMRAKKQLIESNLPLALWFTKRSPRGNLEFQDILQEARIGLIQAVEQFDYTRGMAFSNLAIKRMRWAVYNAHRVRSEMTERVFKGLIDLRKAEDNFFFREGRQPTEDELMAEADISEALARELSKVASRRPISINAPLSDENACELESIIEDTDAISPLEMAIHTPQYRQELINAAMETPFGQRVIPILVLNSGVSAENTHLLGAEFIARHNITPGTSYSNNQIGQMYGVSGEAIRQRRDKDLALLRPYLKQLMDGESY